jgi:hypothetical protein
MTYGERLNETKIAIIVTIHQADVDFHDIAKCVDAHYDQVRKAYYRYIDNITLPPKINIRSRVIKGPLALAICNIAK